MNTERALGHITPEELEEYFYGGLLSEDRNVLIEEHLAVCDECTLQARQHHLSSTISEEGWTARSHGEAYWSAKILTALARVARQHAAQPAWQQRLQAWGHAQGHAPARLLLLCLVPAATPLLRQPLRTRGFPPTGSAVIVTAPQSGARVQIRDRTVEVTIPELDEHAQQTPLVMLLPTQENGEPQIREMTRETTAGQNEVLVAWFEQVPPGEYLVVLEPQSKSTLNT